MRPLSKLLESIGGPDAAATAEAQRHLDTLTKPPGSLGRLEELAARLAAVTGRAPRVSRPVIFTFAADHGVVAEGVSAYPQSVTAQMVENFLRGGAAVNVLARQAGARVVVADFGVATLLGAAPGLVSRRFGPGTRNMAVGPAMTREQAMAAIEVGATLADDAIATGADLLGTGEMGIGNTTAASAITAAITGADADAVTGRGTGVDDEGRRRKVAVVRRALEVNRPDARDHVQHALAPAHPAVQVVRGAAGDDRVQAGIDEVGADLEGLHGEPATPQRFEQPQRDRRLAHAARDTGQDDRAGAHGTGPSTPADLNVAISP